MGMLASNIDGYLPDNIMEADKEKTKSEEEVGIGHFDNDINSKENENINENEKGKEDHNNIVKFYNYHEYQCPYNESVIISHYPNPYPYPYLEGKCRVVRIPRLASKDYPQFSTCLPGFEEGAIKSENSLDSNRFIPKYTYINQRFGNCSISPLSNYIERVEFEEIIIQINKYLFDIYSSKPTNILWLLFNMIFLDIPDLFCFLIRKVFTLNIRNTKLELYINELNYKFRHEGRPIRIVQPRESGYLSIDWIIPNQNPVDINDL